jgi:3-deoxy-D-manno-octulosonic-acid transferase
MINLYKNITRYSEPALHLLLHMRLRKGKEEKPRIKERTGQPSCPRPEGKIAWIHAASVGEAQSALIVIDSLVKKYPDLRILVTSGTVTSAGLMQKRLPAAAFHQYYPLDHPEWVKKFLDYWHPEVVFWMESELWPNMLSEIRSRKIPAVLLNGRLSPKSYRRWKKTSQSIKSLLGVFSLLIVQTGKDAEYYSDLGAGNIKVTDNLKYSAQPLPADREKLDALAKAIGRRPFWVYASTHEGEESLACRLHESLSHDYPDLLTILVPRHPERGERVLNICLDAIMNARRRSKHHQLPRHDDDIYIADTLGELGLFYKLSPVACIGRSFSKDGGGGHNPIEAAQLGCAVLHGPDVHNLENIYTEMNHSGACIKLDSEEDFEKELRKLLGNPDYLVSMQEKALAFASRKSKVIENVMGHIDPLINDIFPDNK